MRLVVVSSGIIFLVLGTVGTYKSSNGIGFTTLIVGGMGALLIAGIGWWPDQVSAGGGGASWGETRVRKLIEQAMESAPPQALPSLKSLLSEVEQPIEGDSYTSFDLKLQKTLLKEFPAARLIRESKVGSMRVDFQLLFDDISLFIETKYLKPPAETFKGVTLDSLIQQMPPNGRLLVIANVQDVQIAREKLLHTLSPDRADVIAWRGPKDNKQLLLTIARLVSTPY